MHYTERDGNSPYFTRNHYITSIFSRHMTDRLRRFVPSMCPMRHVLVVLLLAAARPALLHAQMEVVPIVTPQRTDSNAVAIAFDHNAYTYSWLLNGSFGFKTETTQGRVTNSSSRSLMVQTQETVRDANTFSFDLMRKLSGTLGLSIEAQSFVSSDNQTFSSGIAAQHSGAGGITWLPMEHLSITPMIGIRLDKQQEISDQGPLYKLVMDLDSLDTGGFRSTAVVHLAESDLSPRRFRNDNADVYIRKDFSEGSADVARVRWAKNRWDFYVPADDAVKAAFGVSTNIRSRTEDSYAVTNVLQYSAQDAFSTAFTATMESRTISNSYRYKALTVLSAIPFSTNVQEFRVEGGFDIRYKTEEIESSVGFVLGERDEKHSIETIGGVDNTFQTQRARQEQRLDNTALTTRLQGSFSGRLSSRDLLTLNGSSGIFRYDTPDTSNTDDRDELMMTGALHEEHTASDYFTLGITAEATLAHTVYLSRERSANNNWNRIFRLAPECITTPFDGVRNKVLFDVLANYTVFDFELLIPTAKSYSYRQVAFVDSFSYDITRSLGFDAYGIVRVYERGELRWQQFSERPLQQVQEVTFSPQLRFSNNETVLCAVGIRSFAQKRFRYDNGERIFESTYYSIGPTAAFTLTLSSRSRVELRGWREYQKQTGAGARGMSNVTMTVRYLL
jgi:hypothetical protein